MSNPLAEILEKVSFRKTVFAAGIVMTISRLLEFYSGHSPNSRGRYLWQLQSQSFDDLEHVHDYIQWMFPLLERSAYNVNAPVLSTSDVVEFRRDERLRCALLESFAVMLNFYGIDKTESTTSDRSEEHTSELQSP